MSLKLRKILPIIGLIIFGYILIKLDIKNIFKEISKANLSYLLIAMLFVFFMLITQTLKWFIIARKQKTKIPFIKAFKINIISLFYGFITPSKIGSVIRADYLKEYNNGKLGKGISNFVLDKVLDLCSLVILAIIFSVMFKDVLDGNYLIYFWILLILLFAVFLIFIDKKRSKFFLKIVYKKILPEKMKVKAKEGFDSFYEDMPKKRYFILFLFANIVNWIVLYTISYFVGLSLGIELSFFYYMAILPIATLVAQIPITIAGLGTREATMMSLFKVVGAGYTKVFSMSMISLFITTIIPTAIGSFLIFKSRRKI